MAEIIKRTPIASINTTRRTFLCHKVPIYFVVMERGRGGEKILIIITIIVAIS